MAKMLRVASDVGGTFTDLVYCEVDQSTGRAGETRSVKADTTPPHFSQGVLNAITKAGLSFEEMAFFAHGSTVVINTLTERKGVKTALVTTAGFRDVLEIARGNRPDLFNFSFRKPPPIIDRHLRFEVQERTAHSGEASHSPGDAEIAEVARLIAESGVEAVAVCLLHSYKNPENERIVAEALRSALPGVSVLASHEISREWREYERTSTTALSAYVHPILDRYVGSLAQAVRDQGFTGEPYFMLSNGGIAPSSTVRQNPIAMVESGPASGIFAAAYLGREISELNLIVLDIGGTTAKCALIEDGKVTISTEYHIERDRKSPGYPIQTPVCEIVEIGNGGGSIAWVDEGDKLHVGPRSAGAIPGPAAYGRGGTNATTTDANLVLGRIDPKSFAGGELEPAWDAVHDAFRPLCDQLSLSEAELARGIVRVANSNMVNALRLISTNKGFDPRDFTLIAFGGGGAMHAMALAEQLSIPKVIIPVNSSVFSAWGMLLSDLRRDYLRTHVVALDGTGASEIKAAFEELERTAEKEFLEQQADAAPTFAWFVDARYSGQEHTVKIPLRLEDIEEAKERFHAAHLRHYTFQLDAKIEVVSLHLVASIEVPKPPIAKRAVTGTPLANALLGTRVVDFDEHGIHESRIYDGLVLDPFITFDGPAIVQEPSVTLVVPPGRRVTVDDFGNYRIVHSEGAVQ